MNVITRMLFCVILLLTTITFPRDLKGNEGKKQCSVFSNPHVESVDVTKYRLFIHQYLFRYLLKDKKIGMFKKMAWKKRIERDAHAISFHDRFNPLLAYRYADFLSLIIQLKGIDQGELYRHFSTQVREWLNTPDVMTLEEAFVNDIQDLYLKGLWKKRLRLFERNGKTLKVRFLNIKDDARENKTHD